MYSVHQEVFHTNLLFPPGSSIEKDVRKLSDDTVRDLGLDQIARRMFREGIQQQQVLSIISELPLDPAVIRYRQDVFEDIFRSTAIVSAFEEVIPKITEITLFSETRKESKSPLQETIWRLGELELYVECVDTLLDALQRPDVHVRSLGLRNLRDHLAATAQSDQFMRLRAELPHMREGLRKKRSVTLGINLDVRLRPVEATLLSINEFSYREQTLLPHLFGLSNENETGTPIHISPIPEEYANNVGIKVPLSPLFQDIEKLLGSTLRPIVRFLNRYVSTHTTSLRSLQQEAAFYLAATAMFREIEDAGLPVSKPIIQENEERHLSTEGFYNVLLALKVAGSEAPRIHTRTIGDEIILNSATFDSEGRIHILTGPNQGGKTTFTQGIGLLQVLSQCGLYAPAKSAEISPADEVFTHFPAEEKGQLSTGRLGEEALRFSAMFERISAYSLVLLNESLTSTSPVEGEYLAEDIIRALSELGSRGIFATHLHGLAERIEQLNKEIAGRSLLGSLVAGIRNDDGSGNAVRTYHIDKGHPIGKSFARDIAEKYGISYAQITRRLKERRVL